MDPTTPEPADLLVGQLIDTYGCLAQIIEHMHANAHRSSAGTPPPVDVLRKLLRESVRDVADRYGDDAVARGAELVDECIEAIADDIFLVPLAPPPGASRRQRRHPRRR